jgi:acetolactate synthase I/II/III large subunit
MKITGADVLLKSLELEGVDVVFGYPGATVISIYDALLNSKIKHYMVRHEQGAAHAADGYARSTGRVGVCLSTSGPGATNLVTGIATSYMDSTPLVAITGQVGTTALGLDSFQEADITGITLPVTKHSYLVKKAEDVARVVREAFYLARSGRPGPVLIDITKDALDAKIEFNPPEKVHLRSYKVFSKGNGGKIAEATTALSKAKKPLICVGGGVITSGASPELLELLQKTDIPVVSTLMGLGSVSAKEKAWLGMLGMHGTPTANYAVDDCDVLLAVGVRFSDRVTGQGKKFAPNATVIHVDIDPAEIGKIIRVAIPIVGDAKSVLGEIAQRVTPPEIEEWLEKISLWRKEYPLRYEKNGQLKPQYVIQQLCEVLGDRGIVTTEVGQNQMWTAQHFSVKNPRTLITSGGLGTMGFGLPAAVGVQIGNPDKVVVDIAGDGSIQMNIQELSTVKQYNLPVKVVILNNSSLGLVKQWQALFFEERYSAVHLEASPDFVKLAEAYGIKGYRITDSSQVRATLEEAIAYPGPVIMDFVIPPDEKVLPMVPPGKGLTEMLGR